MLLKIKQIIKGTYRPSFEGHFRFQKKYFPGERPYTKEEYTCFNVVHDSKSLTLETKSFERLTNDVALRHKPAKTHYFQIVDDLNPEGSDPLCGLIPCGDPIHDANPTPEKFQKLSWRRDGALVCEGVGKTLFGTESKNAIVMKMSWDSQHIIKETYINYFFKGPFGGYWFSDDNDVSKSQRVIREVSAPVGPHGGFPKEVKEVCFSCKVYSALDQAEMWNSLAHSHKKSEGKHRIILSDKDLRMTERFP